MIHGVRVARRHLRFVICGDEARSPDPRRNKPAFKEVPCHLARWPRWQVQRAVGDGPDCSTVHAQCARFWGYFDGTSCTRAECGERARVIVIGPAWDCLEVDGRN